MNEWLLVYDDFDPASVGEREALCTLGNGYFATRGALAECDADDVHYPGTYIAGVYNRLSDEIAGRRIDNESLVNAPNWLPVRFHTDDGTCFSAATAEVLWHRSELDMYRGVLSQKTGYRDDKGRVLRVTARRFVSMRDRHMAGIEVTVVPENWSGRLHTSSALDGGICNCGVPRYRDLSTKHLQPICTNRVNDEVMCLHVETNQSRIRIAEAARTRVFHNGDILSEPAELEERGGYIALGRNIDVAEGDEVTVEKIVSLYTSRDHGFGEPSEEACHAVRHFLGGFDDLLSRHAVSWRHIWSRVRIDVGADGGLQLALHLDLFHLCQTVSNNSINNDVGVPARGLHGEAYRGHVFWDELYILPLLSLRLPQLSRSLLLYRYNRIDHARQAARDCGYAGAMYPWQSAGNGREETQTMHLNPKSGRWLPDNTHLQWHVNSAIAYNVWRYYQTTGDREFLSFYGAEMLFEIARFWASAARWNPERQRYDICGVMGPDEFHDQYPWRDTPGLDNNTYTNVMAAWVLQRALETRDLIGRNRRAELCERLALGQEEFALWDDVSHQLYISFHDGIPSQFEGYERLEELDWEGYRRKYGDIHRLDRILEAEGDSVNRYKASKQADVLMLLYLFSIEELRLLSRQLSYPVDEHMLRRTIDYYLQRTSHGSTLSKVVHSWVLARSDRPHSWDVLKEALESDISDVQGGTTPEGIHLGAMAGTVNFVQEAQTGFEIRDGTLRINPCLPEPLQRLCLRLRYRGHWLDLDFNRDSMTIAAPGGWAGPQQLLVGNQRYPFGPGQSLKIPCTRINGARRAASAPSGESG